MTGMEATETADYVVHHLRIAGRRDTPRSDDALARIHQVFRGLPRAVDDLAVQSLVAAFFAESKAIVDEFSARAAVTEVTAE
jgi:type II secretory pathway predicted ATPase ExeA